MAVIITCLNCERDFSVPNYRATSAKFCGRRCMGLYGHKIGRFQPQNRSYMQGNQLRKGLKPANAFAEKHVPWNKGKKGIHLSPTTEFRPGHISDKRLPVGTIRERTCRGIARKWIKIDDPNHWRELARVIWERTHGPSPIGSVLHHKDKNALNDTIENLEVLTRSQHMLAHYTEIRAAHSNVSGA